MISKTSSCVSGTCSLGLRMNVLPHAMANGRNHMGTMAGKLNGTIAAHTPTGWRYVSQSIAVATFSRLRPCIVVGIAVAASTISTMRDTSARASGNVLPISVVTRLASSSARALSASRRPNSQRARSMVERERQAGNASRAAATAASTSGRPESGTCASTSPLAGLSTSSASAAVLGIHAPPT